MPGSGSWDDFIAAFFAHNGESPTVKDLSYEFDYYSCGYHWRDAAYPYPKGEWPDGFSALVQRALGQATLKPGTKGWFLRP